MSEPRCPYVISTQTHPGYPFGPFRCTEDEGHEGKHGGGGMEWTGGVTILEVPCGNTGCTDADGAYSKAPFPIHVMADHGPDGCSKCSCRWQPGVLPAIERAGTVVATVERAQEHHVLPVEDGVVVRGHEARIDCTACRPVPKRDGPLDDPIWSHSEPNWPGASEGFIS